jgi:metal-responsive CopG/Arc/MetJ family transcriptional regulator
MKRSLSITIDDDLVSRVEHLAGSGENRSATIERLLRTAVEAAEEAALMEQYARGYAEHPHTDEEEAILDSFQRLSARGV